MDRVAKERLMNDDFIARSQSVSSVTQLTKCWKCLMFVLTIINIIACVTACICAGYCYKTTLIKERIHETSTFKPEIGTTAYAHAHEYFREYVEIVPTDSVEYIYEDDLLNEYEDEEEYQEYDEDSDDDDEEEYTDGSGNSDEDHDTAVDDEDNSLESSGYGAEEVGPDIELNSKNNNLMKEPYNRKRRSAENNCETKCQGKVGKRKNKCINRCIKKKNSPKGKNKKNVSKEPISIDLPAAHFEAGFTDEEVADQVNGHFSSYRHTNVCKYIPKLEGTLCLNRSFTPIEPGMTPLRIFQKSSWYDDNKSPVKFSNSVVTAKTGGIYLVYAQAYINGKESMKSIAIVQKRNGEVVNKLRCDNGVNSEVGTSQLQTCSITGTMQLLASDTIEIQSSKHGDSVVIQKDMTYFGLVKISGDGAESKGKTHKRN